MLSISFIFAYILGGITFIPINLLLIYCIYRLKTYLIPSSNDKHSMADNDDMPTTHGQQKDHLYKVGWLTVSRTTGKDSQDGSIGDMVINYFSGLGRKEEVSNVYFSVLKNNTLFLYDSEKQLDCKGVVNLSHFHIKMNPAGLQDYELFSKPNSIRLQDNNNSNINYYINCSKCIDKEDWYFSFIRASQFISPANNTSKQQDTTRFDQAAMNHLIKMVYSDEHHFQTQWLNALLGRIFLGVYRTKDIKDALYKKVITKLDKINAKRPPFLGEITVRSADPGHSLPRFTQPKLLSLDPNGELTAEVMMEYDGGFRLEIETELRWKYSDHRKPLTMDLVLGITLKEIAGKLLIKLKEPPTNRFWYGFYECPKMKWKVDPLLWERRVGYSVVVKAIETKIQEFIMETMVLPHFDDITFFPTNGVGGIFETATPTTDEALLSTAKSLPELFSSAISSDSTLSSSLDTHLSTSPSIPPMCNDDDSLLGLSLCSSQEEDIIITPSTSSSSTSTSQFGDDKIKLKKKSSITTLLRPKTFASTAINVSPVMAFKSAISM